MKEAVVVARGVQASLPQNAALQLSPPRKPGPIAPALGRAPADAVTTVEPWIPAYGMTNWVGQSQFSWVWDRHGRR